MRRGLVACIAAMVLAGGVVTGGEAAADHTEFDSNTCVTDGSFQFREEVQVLVDLFYGAEDPNPYHLDNDGNGIACDDGSNSIPNDPDPAFNTAPIGYLDSASSPATGQLRVTGWAIDPDVPSWSPAVHIYVDNTGYVIPRAQVERPDVAAAFPDAPVGPRHGYDATIVVSPGAHRVCAYAINYGPYSPNSQLGCRSVIVGGAPSYSPVGSLDPLAFFPDGSVVVYGWAADPEAITQPLDIHVYVDGVRGYVERTGTHPRPDVLAVTGAPNAGMVGVLPPQGPGRHTVCAFAINVGATGTNSNIGCRTYG